MKYRALVEQVVREFCEEMGEEDEKFIQLAVDRLSVSNPHGGMNIPKSQVPAYKRALAMFCLLAFYNPEGAKSVLVECEKKFGMFNRNCN
jgi:hypothetical protein